MLSILCRKLVWWNNNLPSSFTSRSMTVCCMGSALSWPGHTLTLLPTVSSLTSTFPSSLTISSLFFSPKITFLVLEFSVWGLWLHLLKFHELISFHLHHVSFSHTLYYLTSCLYIIFHLHLCVKLTAQFLCLQKTTQKNLRLEVKQKAHISQRSNQNT